MTDYEKLGAFYLGRVHDLETGQTRPDPLLYDSKDLTTHAVCVGMTGSGKTGLCLSLLEEAAIDGIPAIAIDPKGDLGNLLLSFPNLAPADFRPWVDEQEAARNGMTADEFAAETARVWRQGLADWDQTPERIARFREAVDVSIYTPASEAGLPLTVLRSFAAPSDAILNDADAMRERITASVSGLLALLGISADPIRSREHILLSNLLDRAWREGRDVDLGGLIHGIQSPPFDKVGFMDLDSFFPSKDRFALSVSLNNLLASPAFASWMVGEPLNIQRLLYTDSGKPRLSVISIAHLSETERMFFVTIMLNEVVSWMRSQPGTSSLRALLYMDEVFGYFPPTANPPSKRPMLTLLKQARAYGLGVVLATQNPVDLDYKGLSNTGTWFLGRLQTERDKARVLEGLEGASVASGASFNRSRMEAILARLGKRVFLMNNVHDDHPVVFETRWALSYLRGPLTRSQIQTLMDPRKQAAAEAAAPKPRTKRETLPKGTMPKDAAPKRGKASGTPNDADGPAASDGSAAAQRPPLPPDVDERFVRLDARIPDGQRLIYRPALLGNGRLHFVRVTYHVDTWEDRTLLVALRDDPPREIWDQAELVAADKLEWDDQPDARGVFADLPSAAMSARKYKSWNTALKDFLYRTQTLTAYRCSELKEYSEADETEGEFRIRLTQRAKEQRDIDVEKLRKKYATKLASLQERIRTAEQRVDREKSQMQTKTVQAAISFGTSVLGALLGRKLLSSTNVSRAGTAMRSAQRASNERSDISRAKESVEALQKKLTDLEQKFQEQVEQVERATHPDQLELEPLDIRPRKSDISTKPILLAWTPWRVDANGIAEPAWNDA